MMLVPALYSTPDRHAKDNGNARCDGSHHRPAGWGTAGCSSQHEATISTPPAHPFFVEGERKPR
jgi:hypothetical protein